MKALKNTLLFLSCLTLCSVAYAAPCDSECDNDTSENETEQCELCDETTPCDLIVDPVEIDDESEV